MHPCSQQLNYNPSSYHLHASFMAKFILCGRTHTLSYIPYCASCYFSGFLTNIYTPIHTPARPNNVLHSSSYIPCIWCDWLISCRWVHDRHNIYIYASYNQDQYCIILAMVCTLKSMFKLNETAYTRAIFLFLCISGHEVFIVNSGVDAALVAEKLNGSSGEQETDTATNLYTTCATDCVLTVSTYCTICANTHNTPWYISRSFS